MALPEVNMTIEDGALGQVPASVANAHVKMGVCSKGLVGGIYAFSDASTARQALGQGPLVEAIADSLSVGGPVYAIVVNPSAYGANGAVSHTGPGTGTVTPSLAPAQSIALKISTGGANGTMAFQVALGTGGYSAPVVSVAGSPFAYAVPGTLTTVTFADGQTYVAGEIYTISASGLVTLTGSGPAASNVTHSDSPLDAYSIVLTITSTGGLGAGVFTYSVDGGNNTSAQISVPSAPGRYAIPFTGVVVTFAGTFTAGDTYAWTTTAAGFSTSDMTAALSALRAAAPEWGFVHVVGTWANAAAAVTAAAVVDSQMTTAEGQFRFAWGMVECPSSQDDATVGAAPANFVSLRTMICAGDIGHVSQISGRILRRNCAWAVATHIANIPAGEDPAWVGTRTPIVNVASLYRDEQKAPFLDALRFTTMRTIPGRAGYFITNGNMMAPGGSDFNLVQRRRVMDVACRITRQAELPYLSGSMRIDPKTGFIDERDAQSFEATVQSQVNAGVVATGDASASSVVVNRATNILSTSNLPVSVRVVPLSYLKQISTSIGFSNPAIAA